MSESESPEQFRTRLGDALCLAKWTQVTIHCPTGTNHSCHHPITHSMDLDDILQNPSAIHNTKHKIEQRRLMLEGIRPSECDYCWRVEDTGSIYSDRLYKSHAEWSRFKYDEIVSNPYTQHVVPTRCEVDFDNTCNFKCAYCGPQYSSQWQKEIRDFGPYDLPTVPGYAKQTETLRPDDNPFVDAFWRWFPDAVSEMLEFRITGGEPLLTKNTWKVLDYLLENPCPRLDLAINSNLGVESTVVRKLIEKLRELKEKNCVAKFTLYTSNEAYGRQAEYIRYGLDYYSWENNVREFVKADIGHLAIMATINLLSFSTYKFLMGMVKGIRDEFVSEKRPWPISVLPMYLRNPQMLTGWQATDKELQWMKDCVQYMTDNHFNGFYPKETEHLTKLITMFEKERSDDKHVAFYQWVTEYDKRRGTDFLDTFPEYKDFYNSAKEKCQNIIIRA